MKVATLPNSSIKISTLGLWSALILLLIMSVFSIAFGGPHCGVLIGLIDAAGYAAAMLYQFGGGSNEVLRDSIAPDLGLHAKGRQ